MRKSQNTPKPKNEVELRADIIYVSERLKYSDAQFKDVKIGIDGLLSLIGLLEEKIEKLENDLSNLETRLDKQSNPGNYYMP